MINDMPVVHEEMSEEKAEPPGTGSRGQTPVITKSEANRPLSFFQSEQSAQVTPTKLATSIKRDTARSPGFIISPRARAFMNRFYPGVTPSEWNDWGWQIRNRIRRQSELSKFIYLSPEETQAFADKRNQFPLSITPYFMSLLDELNAQQPLRRTVVPVAAEAIQGPGEKDDPLGEDGHSPVPGLVHRYPDRVLFLVTGFCSTYCRYCTRSRIVGRAQGCQINRKHWEKAVAYIAATPTIRDVLLSGGDPLTLSDDTLEWLLAKLRKIRHVEFLRIGTKIPVVLPQRITPALTRMLKRYHPLWMSIHFTHPEELTPETSMACRRLADAGIPLGSQTVLLKGVNDDGETMTRLMQGLLRIRVRPYYLYQCDPITGSAHFRTSVQKGVDIIRCLRGHTSGYAVPNYVIDAPGGGGKIPLIPDYTAGRDGGDLLLENYEGNLYRYPDVCSE